MIFVMDSPNFSLVSFQEIVICKNNSIRNALNSNFDVPILNAKAESNRALGIFMAENIESNELASSTRK